MTTGSTEDSRGLAEKVSDDSGPTEEIPVEISFEIIRLFSEGLYQSPHKAIEELVSNGFDAGANQVRVITPRSLADDPSGTDSLWVIDDGCGMDAEGFARLWRVAESTKTEGSTVRGRAPIGQFGIGKLAAYVLARRLTHISKRDGQYLYASMDFKKVEGKRQNDRNSTPVAVDLHIVDEEDARKLLSEVEVRDPDAWSLLFGDKAANTWTAAALSDFKKLFEKFKPGVLGWVLRTGLPLSSNFRIYLNSEEQRSAKEEATILYFSKIGGPEDKVAEKLGLETTLTGLKIPGLVGEVSGKATLYEKPLQAGKSMQYGRSNGFFIRVRGRVINLEDELFGLEALNHAAWSRFSLDAEVDGLREHLLSSREGVRDSAVLDALREYLRAKFNEARAAFNADNRTKLIGIDLEQLLNGASPSVLGDPLLSAVRQAIAHEQQPSHYISAPTHLADEERAAWFAEFTLGVLQQPILDVKITKMGPYDRLVEYDTTTRILQINEEHPFIAKMLAHSKNQTPVTLFATSEILTDAFLREGGISPETTAEVFSLRDRALRQIAGDYGPDAAEVLRHLSIADQDKDALEKAVGQAFIVLGFEYERRGGNRGGADGILDARLGKSETKLEDFRIVYDAKTTAGSSISVDKVHFDALWDFKKTESADFGFIIGKKFAGQESDDSAVNRRTSQGREDRPMTVMLTAHLRRLVELHYRFGVTLTQVRDLFDGALTVKEVEEWLQKLEKELSESQPPVPLRKLLKKLEECKGDTLSQPNIHAVRMLDARLKQYEPERLVAALQAVQTIVGTRWIEVNKASGDVRMSHTAESIITEVDRRLQDDLGLPAVEDETPES
ncbi:Histidine kinase-, DNA gyrase B-, and HSP90-like ATPase [Actinacidiphila alni]|uniref:Histidine kinase-, DNA gyrase B-, and HSP90-like ATPase n=1 Tax=Actinacidiphila alni TaxID=380248 RepID=A0A1I1ZAI6_9ACTN|nr:ATP-binding protein [Actinacidiphila alni]SFE28864.1 Histidine kinase-, DNA gyrase B-, and HSP90-like ATPase [Actinacidiphila alni]